MTTRVILVCGQYPTATQWGGIGAYTRHHARRLHAAGVLVHVVTGIDGATPRTEHSDGFPVHRVVPTSGGDAGLDRHALSDVLRAFVRSGDADLIEGPEYAAPLLAFQRQQPAVPVVVRLHGAAMLVREVSQPRWRTLLAPLSAAASRAVRDERESVQRATLVSSPAHWSIATLRARGWSLGTAPMVAPNPIVLDALAPLPWESRHADAVCIPGRLDRVKGADLLPAIMRAVWRERPSTRFVSIGQDTPRVGGHTWGGWLLGQLTAEQRARVTLRGGMPPAAMATEVAAHRIAVLASVFETFPYTLMEAMALGLCCVVACDGGAREMGEHGRHLMLAPRTPEAIAAVLLQLLSQPGTVRALGDAACAHVHSEIASAEVTHRVIACYTDLVAAHARRSAA